MKGYAGNSGKERDYICHKVSLKRQSEVAQSCPTLCIPMDCSLPGSSSRGYSRHEYCVDCHSLLQRIFPTQRLNLGLLHCRQILYHLSYREDLSSLKRPFNKNEILSILLENIYHPTDLTKKVEDHIQTVSLRNALGKQELTCLWLVCCPLSAELPCTSGSGPGRNAARSGCRARFLTGSAPSSSLGSSWSRGLQEPNAINRSLITLSLMC